ncbi:MAG: permease-like cell division protein FtsX [Candidatus Baltobacteraceae bacterium]
MDWGKTNFFLGEVARSFTRNAGMQITAIGTVTVTIVLLGAFLYVRAAMAHAGSDMLSQISISVYTSNEATQAQVDALRTALAKDKRILDASFVPKKQGLAELRARLRGKIDTSTLVENPLPDKFRVHVRDPQQLTAVAKSLQKLPGVQEVDYGQETVRQLLALGAAARRIGIAVIALFVLTAGIIISNTIRLTVFARRREISIMQLVGATNFYIRLPFICEGLLAGIMGALLAIGLLALARGAFFRELALAPAWMQGSAVNVDVTTLLLELIAVGGAVGVVASWIAVGRYLRT